MPGRFVITGYQTEARKVWEFPYQSDLSRPVARKMALVFARRRKEQGWEINPIEDMDAETNAILETVEV